MFVLLLYPKQSLLIHYSSKAEKGRTLFILFLASTLNI
ncbi:hypothetical protein BsLM_0954 [Bacillus sp. LM 4-2]|nr:hypothetical protein BsLM_0954 [Bacillus sp. LM 4-2]